ncbi:unnamed protein product [Gordionus sp. m RMFG-2023]
MISNSTEIILSNYNATSLDQNSSLEEYNSKNRQNCTHVGSLDQPKLFITAIFTSVIWVIGYIGNLIGFYAAWKDKSKYVRVILMEAFHAINLVNLHFMFLYPLLETFAECYLWKLWNSYHWKYYLSTLHFPLAKTFLSLSFSIYVIFAYIQMVAVLHPIYYRERFTTRKIKFMILGCFIYLSIWFLPSGWWFQVIKTSNICDKDATFILYSRNLKPFKSSRDKYSWTTYVLLREFMTKFLPVTVILIFNVWSLKRKKEMLGNPESNFLNNLGGIASISDNRIRDGIVGDEDRNFSAINFQDISNDLDLKSKRSLKISPRDNPTNTVNFFNIREIKMRRKWKEYNITKRMLLINMLEYLIFLFPVPLYIIFVNFVDSHTINDHEELVFSACILVEYMYVSLTFYLNLLFNPGYREEIAKLLRKSISQ